MEDKWNKEIRHQIDVITDSDWFMELVEKKIKHIIEENSPHRKALYALNCLLFQSNIWKKEQEFYEERRDVKDAHKIPTNELDDDYIYQQLRVIEDYIKERA